MSIQTFTKAYTRDNCFIIQEAWGRAFTEDYAGNANPYAPAQINHLADGVVEIWDNDQAIAWFRDHLLSQNASRPRFFSFEIEKYLDVAERVKASADRECFTSLDKLRAFIELIGRGTRGFLLFYYSALDPRTPAAIRERALEIRETDSFYDHADRLIKTTIERIHPHTEGVSVSVMSDELEAPPARDVLLARFRHSIMIAGRTPELSDLTAFLAKHPEFRCDIPQAVAASELRGETAFPGKAVGMVRILKRKNQVGELREGEILVSPMTTPDFVPAMRRAAAIVTDEGGVTCHAAIVSRELKIPCVVGTRTATEIFKDGDLVEVDAERGIVRKLS